MRDAKELRVKESDRIAAVATNLRKMGAQVEEFEDGLKIPGGQISARRGPRFFRRPSHSDGIRGRGTASRRRNDDLAARNRRRFLIPHFSRSWKKSPKRLKIRSSETNLHKGAQRLTG